MTLFDFINTYLYIKWFCFGCIGNILRAKSVIPFIFILFQNDSIVIQSILRSSLLRFTVSSLDELFLGGFQFIIVISTRAYRHRFKKKVAAGGWAVCQ